jgi:hypothetical protein
MKRLNIYIIHAAYLIDRRRVLDDLKKTFGKYTFSNLKLGSITVVTKYDPDSLTPEFVQPKVNYMPLAANVPESQLYNPFIRVLHVNNVSNALKHHEALRVVSEAAEDELHLVLEDDLLYEPKVCLMIDRLVAKLDNTMEMVFLGFPNNEPISQATNVISLKETKNVFKIIPYLDSYFISPPTAKKLASEFLPIKFHTNIHMDYLIRKHNINSQQCVPNIFVDGTKYGLFLSTQILNNELIFNKDYMMMKELCEKTPLSRDEKQMIQELIDKSFLAQHPDFLFLVAKYYRTNVKDMKKTYELYQQMYDIYKRNNIHMNNESLFLREYISLHAHLQPDL